MTTTATKTQLDDCTNDVQSTNYTTTNYTLLGNPNDDNDDNIPPPPPLPPPSSCMSSRRRFYSLFRRGQSEQDGEMKELATVDSISWFGEIALIQDCQRTATVETSEDSTLLVLSKENFHRFLRVVLTLIHGTMTQQTVFPQREYMGIRWKYRLPSECVRRVY